MQTIAQRNEILRRFVTYGVTIRPGLFFIFKQSHEDIAREAVNEFAREGAKLVRADTGFREFTVWVDFETPDGVGTIQDFAQTLLLVTNRATGFSLTGASLGAIVIETDFTPPPTPPQPAPPAGPAIPIATAVIAAIIIFFVLRRG